MTFRYTFIFAMLVFLLTCQWAAPLLAGADTTQAQEAPADTGKITDNLDELLAKIDTQKNLLAALQRQRASREGIARQVLGKRVDKATLELLNQELAYVSDVADLEETTRELEHYRRQAIGILASHYQMAMNSIKKSRSKISMPKADISSTDLATVYSEISNQQKTVNQALKITMDNLELANKLNLDVSQNETTLKNEVEDIAVSRSILLELQTQAVNALSESVKASPDDKPLKSKLDLAKKHLNQLADNFSAVLNIMNTFEMNDTFYREQILKATGTISADSAEISVITDLLIGWGKAMWTALIEDGPDLLFKAILFLLILYIAHKLGNLLKRIVEKAFQRSNLQPSELLRRMILSLAHNLILIFGFLIGLSQLGISLGPLLAGFGIVGFIVGFALQDSLSNFASGLMILIYRPYDVGDIIEAAGVFGRVNHMSLVNTTMITFDNQTIVIPNSKIWGDVIKNVTSQTLRRVDMTFGISYSDNVDHAEQVLLQILEADDRILSDPPPMVKLHELGDSSVNFVVRPWVNKDDYWNVYWDVTRAVKIRFDEEGLSIPFPQRDVHLFTQTDNS